MPSAIDSAPTRAMKILLPIFAILLGLTLAASVTGCGEPDNCESSITVSRGVRPTYRFTGGPVNALSIARAADPENIVWGLATPDADAVESPIVHAGVPDKTLQTAQGERSLVGGERYNARIQRESGEVCEIDFIVE